MSPRTLDRDAYAELTMRFSPEEVADELLDSPALRKLLIELDRGEWEGRAPTLLIALQGFCESVRERLADGALNDALEDPRS